MKNRSNIANIACLLVLLLGACSTTPLPQPTSTPIPATPTLSAPDAVDNLHWFNTSAILYHGSQNIYFDPVALDGDLPAADIILVSHGHSDHFERASIKTIIGPNTTLIVSRNAYAAYEPFQEEIGIPATVLEEGKSIEVNGIQIEAVPMFDGRNHQRTGDNAGFIVTIDGVRIYHAGDTMFFPEMADLQCDIALYPVTTNDDIEQVVAVLQTKVMIFMHTSTSGSRAFANLYKVKNPAIQFILPASGPYTP
jgi:L-ascorbate metabolism protein UlaG (beta-lactamase superfamily)